MDEDARLAEILALMGADDAYFRLQCPTRGKPPPCPRCGSAAVSAEHSWGWVCRSCDAAWDAQREETNERR